MHELGIVFHVIRAVENIGREQGLTDVASVTLELGQVSGVVPHELESCWKWAVARTELMPRAALRIETVPAGQRAGASCGRRRRRVRRVHPAGHRTGLRHLCNERPALQRFS